MPKFEPTVKPYAIGSPEWPGLAKAQEETAELNVELAKLIGHEGELDHWDGKGNLMERIEHEMADTMAALLFFAEANGFNLKAMRKRTKKKFKKFKNWHRNPQRANMGFRPMPAGVYHVEAVRVKKRKKKEKK